MDAQWLARLGHWQRRYLAIDAGAGAHLIAALMGSDPRLEQVSSPRHADLLIIFGPISNKLAPALVTIARTIPHPAHALLICGSDLDALPGWDITSAEQLLPGARQASGASVEHILTAALDQPNWPELVVANEPTRTPDTTTLPPTHEQELQTEPVVLSMGPLQPFTSGPLRLLLICDGEQIISAEVETGYAYRGVAQAMVQADWCTGAAHARRLDPLAPLAGLLSYVQAVEALQGWQAPPGVSDLRAVALAVERAQNHLWWLLRFAQLLAFAPLVDQARQLATNLARLAPTLWTQQPSEWLYPHGGAEATRQRAPAAQTLRKLADRIVALAERLSHDRFLALRTRNIGLLAPTTLHAYHISGPVLEASEQGTGDVQSRLLIRLQKASADLRSAAEGIAEAELLERRSPVWQVPTGETFTVVEGPRGSLGLHLVSVGGDGPAHVEWQRPSAALLALLPELLAGQKLADAEVILASLDLATTEADG